MDRKALSSVSASLPVRRRYKTPSSNDSRSLARLGVAKRRLVGKRRLVDAASAESVGDFAHAPFRLRPGAAGGALRVGGAQRLNPPVGRDGPDDIGRPAVRARWIRHSSTPRSMRGRSQATIRFHSASDSFQRGEDSSQRADAVELVRDDGQAEPPILLRAADQRHGLHDVAPGHPRPAKPSGGRRYGAAPCRCRTASCVRRPEQSPAPAGGGLDCRRFFAHLAKKYRGAVAALDQMLRDTVHRKEGSMNKSGASAHFTVSRPPVCWRWPRARAANRDATARFAGMVLGTPPAENIAVGGLCQGGRANRGGRRDGRRVRGQGRVVAGSRFLAGLATGYEELTDAYSERSGRQPENRLREFQSAINEYRRQTRQNANRLRREHGRGAKSYRRAGTR